MSEKRTDIAAAALAVCLVFGFLAPVLRTSLMDQGSKLMKS